MIGRSKHRWLPALLALACWLTFGCSAESVMPAVDELAGSLEEELSKQGEDPVVVDCVVSTAERRFRYGDIDDATKDELIQSCSRANHDLTKGDPTITASDPLPYIVSATYGDDQALDLLWDRCAEGKGAACDELFHQAPLGSGYEQFGLSCGQRDEILECAELDQTETDEPVEADSIG